MRCYETWGSQDFKNTTRVLLRWRIDNIFEMIYCGIDEKPDLYLSKPPGKTITYPIKMPLFFQFCGYVSTLLDGICFFFLNYLGWRFPLCSGGISYPVGGRRSCESFLSDGELVWWQVITGAPAARLGFGPERPCEKVQGSLNGTHFGCIKLDANIWSIWNDFPIFLCIVRIGNIMTREKVQVGRSWIFLVRKRVGGWPK